MAILTPTFLRVSETRLIFHRKKKTKKKHWTTYRLQKCEEYITKLRFCSVEEVGDDRGT